MNHLSSSELLIEAFTAQKLVDIEQDIDHPPLSDKAFIDLVDTRRFDYSIAIIPQLKTLSAEITHHHVPAHIINYCLFIDYYYETLESKPYFHKDLNEALTELKPVLLKTLVTEPKFLQSSRHFLRVLLDDLFTYYAVWDNSLGIQSKQLYNRLTHLIASLQTLTTENRSLPELIVKETETLQKIFNHFQSIEKKTCSKEKEKLSLQITKKTVNDLLDQSLHEKELPSCILNFLTGMWKKTLIDELHSRQKDDPTYTALVTFTQELIKHFHSNKTEENAAERLAFIPTIKPTIEKYIDKFQHEKITGIFIDIDRINMNILNGEKYATEKAHKLCEENKPEFKNLSKSIIDISSKLKKGQLITFDDIEKKRARISDSYPELGEFLFTTATGEKTLQKSYASLGYELLSKNYQLLESKNLFNKIFSKAIEKIINRHKHIIQQIESNNEELTHKKRKEAALKKAQKEAIELKKQKEEIEKKHAQEIEHLRKKQEDQEAKLKELFLKQHQEEAEKLKSLNEELEEKLREESAINQLNCISEKVRSLTIGSWLNITLDNGETIECKIAMIYPSSGKIVFVDTIGKKVDEFMPSRLIEKMLAGEAKIIKNESSFESSMERVVTSLQR